MKILFGLLAIILFIGVGCQKSSHQPAQSQATAFVNKTQQTLTFITPNVIETGKKVKAEARSSAARLQRYHNLYN